jgi:hypothetical protein
MKKQLHYITIILMLAGTLASWAQQTRQDMFMVMDTIDGLPVKRYYQSEKIYKTLKQKRESRITELREEKKIFESNVRTELADRIEVINLRAEKDDNYTLEMAKKDKEISAARYAQQISTHNQMIDAQIAYMKVVDNPYRTEENFINQPRYGMSSSIISREKRSQTNIYTSSGFTIGLGYNFINGNNLGIDDFSYGNNNYFSIGYNWKTALNKNQTLRFLYGIEYQSQGTELNGNRAFTISNPDNTQIERLNFDADKAKFRQDQLVFPVHFEIGGTERKEYEDGRVRYNEYDQFKLGIGGYAGFNLSSRLKYKFELENEDIKQTTINAFDNNVLVYGLDAYIGFDSFTVFGRMALNDIFQSGSVDGQYVAFGIRLQ